MTTGGSRMAVVAAEMSVLAPEVAAGRLTQPYLPTGGTVQRGRTKISR